jgi:tRNA threonylcarbamoyladenosine biosynthesis protein TsaB
MVTLVLDTCTEKGLIAWIDEALQKELFRREFPMGFAASKLLFPIIQEGIAEVGEKVTKKIVATIGPGSYTGMRVGAAAAISLAYGWDIELFYVPSLFGFLPKKEGVFASLIDAKMGGFYFLLGQSEGGKVEYLSSPKRLSIEELRETLEESCCKYIVSPHPSLILERLNLRDISGEEVTADPCALIKVALPCEGSLAREQALPLLYLN